MYYAFSIILTPPTFLHQYLPKARGILKNYLTNSDIFITIKIELLKRGLKMANKNHFDFDKINAIYRDSQIENPSKKSKKTNFKPLSEEDFDRVAKKQFDNIKKIFENNGNK